MSTSSDATFSRRKELSGDGHIEAAFCIEPSCDVVCLVPCDRSTGLVGRGATRARRCATVTEAPAEE